MAAQYKRLLDATILKPDLVQPLRDSYEAGAFKTLEVHARILKTGSGGTIRLQHAAVNEDDAYIDLTGASWTLNTGTGGFVSIGAFLRYVRWICDSNVGGDPVVLIDVVAKE